jgi:hypothetical protein
MAINDSGLIVGAFGALFTAANLKNPITVSGSVGKVANFTLEGTTPSDWNHWGHLSSEALPAPAQDGGESTALRTWLKTNTDAIASPKTSKLAFTGMQTDSETLAEFAAAERAGVPLSLFMLMIGANGKRWGTWWPSAMFNLTGEPTPALANYSTIGFEFTRMAHSLDLTTTVDVTAGAGIFREGVIFDDEAFATVA